MCKLFRILTVVDIPEIKKKNLVSSKYFCNFTNIKKKSYNIFFILITALDIRFSVTGKLMCVRFIYWLQLPLVSSSCIPTVHLLLSNT